jgi:hypothetical protein
VGLPGQARTGRARGTTPGRRARSHGAADPGADLPADHGARRAQGDAAAALRGEGARGRAERAHRPHRRHGLRHVQRLRRADPHADRRSPRQRRAALQPVPHDGALFAHAHGAAQRPQPPHEQHGLDRGDRHRVPGQYGAAPGQRGAARRDAAAERLQHELLRQEPRDGGLGGQPFRAHDPLANALRVRRVLRVHRGRNEPVGAAPLSRLEQGGASEGPQVPLHDGHDGQGDRLDAVPEVPHAGPALLHVLRAGRDPRAAPRAEGVDREVQGQVRPGVGRDAGRGPRPTDHARRGTGRHEARTR